MHKLFYFWGKGGTLERVFIKNIWRPPLASPGWAAQAHFHPA